MTQARQVAWVSWAVMAAIASWLLASLFWVNIDGDDGYTTIANAQYFLDISPDYFWQRGPLVAWLLMPTEWLANRLHLAPMDVRPHHAMMVLLHLGYLIGVWSLLRQQFGRTWPVLLAYLAAIPTVVFFSYAPFVSHDLFPGLLLLLMLFSADVFHRRPSVILWISLVLLGALAALVKQTYALIWVSLLLANALLVLLEPRERRHWKWLAALAAGAASSGIITWLIYSIVLGAGFPDVPMLLRPWHQTQEFVHWFQREGSIGEIIYQWVYLRNLSAYGVCAMALVIPGLVLSWRNGNRLQRCTVLVWLLLAIAMQQLHFKEVRYLSYLAPLTAVLLVPVMTALWRWRALYRVLIMALLLVDLSAASTEAARIANPFYRSQVSDFLRALPPASQFTGKIVMTERLSFVSPERSAFFGDRYHRITNIIDDQIRLLYGYRADQVIRFRDREALAAEQFEPGDVLIFVNDVAARVPPIAADNRTTLQDHFAQLLGTAERIRLLREGDRYRVSGASAQPLMLLRANGSDAQPIVFTEFVEPSQLRDLALDDGHSQSLELIAFRIHAYCNITGCQTFP